MNEIFDHFSWTKQNKTITKDKHHVPALGNFTYWNFTASPSPSPLHYHSDIIEIHCMIKGQRYSQVEDGGQLKHFTYTGNEAFLTFPFELHGNGSQPQLPCEFYAFQIITKDPNHMLGLNEEYSRSLCQILLSLKYRHFKLGMTHIQYLRSAFNFFSDMTPGSIQIGTQFLTCFLFSLQFLTPIQNNDILTIDNRIYQAISYLNKNISEPLQLEDLAAVSGYSLSRFKVKFKQEVGITPAEYITLQKLEYAKRELAETDVSITDLAYSLGFSSSNYFSSVFKKFLDCTPKDYRKQRRPAET
ncbi:AraC family transcriptional regulator [Clostridium sp. AM58-1XD]|uniref:helix-turn-helix transcriptional regulator n=1 Tax=Clostridium sp. AM58-1XD TaxID=2292307 RepID=UPI000E54ECA8|nr:AraC family transcriptional regulator [Clostridium sp. AM58-1XD]RGZ01185.1 AraC family transcriptional regulator [Clostridium sp. AM58-1XD]